MMTSAVLRKPHLEEQQVHSFLEPLFAEDLHAIRILSLSHAVLGVIHAASLGVHTIGKALAWARGTRGKRGVKQVDRMWHTGPIHPGADGGRVVVEFEATKDSGPRRVHPQAVGYRGAHGCTRQGDISVGLNCLLGIVGWFVCLHVFPFKGGAHEGIPPRQSNDHETLTGDSDALCVLCLPAGQPFVCLFPGGELMGDFELE